jgi:hypothetical protein
VHILLAVAAIAILFVSLFGFAAVRVYVDSLDKDADTGASN